MHEPNDVGTGNCSSDCEMDLVCLQILEHAPEPAFIVDCTSADTPRVMDANPAWITLLGLSQKIERGLPLKTLLDQEQSIQLASHLGRCLETGTGLSYRHVVTTQGRQRHLQTSLTPLHQTEGPIQRVLGISRDITEQQQAQAQSVLLEFALNQVHEAAYLLDSQARIHYVNREACRMLGFSQDELLRMSVPDLDTNWPMERWPAIWSKVMQLGSLTFETSHQTKDGRIIPVEISSCYLQHQGQDYEFALVRDITERKRVEAAMHARSEEFRALVENSPDLVLRYDRDCRRVYANPAFLEISGLSLAQLVGKTPTEQQVLLVEPEAYEIRIKEVIETGTPAELTFSWRSQDGREFWSHARFVPEWDADNRISSVLAICHDVSSLKQTEQQLSTLINNIPEMVSRFDLEARHIYVNPTICKVFATSADNLLGKQPQGMASDGRSMAQWILEVVNTGKPNSCEVTWQLPIGTRSYSVRHVPETDRVGQVTSVLGIATDITALKAAEHKFRTLAENLPDVVIRYDRECRRTYVNPAYERVTGNRAEDALGITPDLLWAPSTPAQAFMSRLRLVIETGVTDEVTLQITTPEGQVNYHSVIVSAERDAGGRIIGALSISRDVTELLETHQALRNSEERYRQIFDNTQESLFLVEVLTNGHFRILEVNPSFEKTLGIDAYHLIGRSLEEAAPKEIAEQLTARFRYCLEVGRITHEEMEIDLGQGMRTLQSTHIPIRDKQGQIHRLVGLTRDITERRQSEVAMRRLNRALKTLSSGNEALVRAASEAELLEQMCKVVVNAGGYELAWIGYSNEDDRITAVSWAGENTGLIATREQLLRQSARPDDPIKRALKSGEVAIVRDPDDPPENTTDTAARPCLGFNACLALPLIIEKGLPGLLCIYSTDPDAFDQNELQLLSELAEDLAYGIHALRVRTERERFVERLQESMEATIQALASTVELRDPYTAGHQRRVAELAIAVARELGWPEEQIQVTYLAGVVHDIGKIAIPAEILSKPGHLSEAEFTLVRTHAEAGYEILKSINFPWPIAKIVQQHHERLNGSGYPLGLHRDEILMEARVLAVCDVVEAMTTHRPYRPGLGVDLALEEIRNGRGTLYDPEVVDSCLKVIRELGFSFS